ncbi:MAG: hypothetical protein JW891_03145 [Candidatus Lokiarchaeota archaeon]|nr:hypothetical protein [Candidatus Lokiarchaeota archaeon]
MTDTQFGNGKMLAETLKGEFSGNNDVKIADVKDVSAETIAKELPDLLIIGGAIRAFRGGPKSKKWLKKFNDALKKSGKKIKFGTGFLTHALPTNKVHGFAKKYLDKIKNSSMIESSYSELLTARVQGLKGPFFPEEVEKAIAYAQDINKWLSE